MIILKRLRVENFKLLQRLDLGFPRQGSVLVEGLNESGKSTLFESVFYALYGTPLVTEGRGKGNLESVIRYGEDVMSVELLVEVDQTELEIRRGVNSWFSHRARIWAGVPGMQDEQVAGVLAVNDRIVRELGGLDGEAMLNSCFVEQKKLSKLEDLVAGQRKDSLRKLLNLEKLTALGEQFRVTNQDERALAEARQRLELAQVAAALPAVTAERVSLESSLRGEGQRGTTASLDGQGACVVHPPMDMPEGRSAPLLGTDDVHLHWDPSRRGTPAWVPWSRQSGGRPHGVARASRSVTAPTRNAHYHSEEEGDTVDRPHNSGMPESADDPEWTGIAARLTAARESASRARRNALLLTVAAAGVTVAVAALALAGVHVALWGLAVSLVFGVLAWFSRRSARALDADASDLERDLSTHRDILVARAGELEGLRIRAERALGVEGQGLEVEECRQEVARLERQLAVKRRAAAIVEGTMERIVRMVLPNTERNLGQILPLLTAGRYHEARIAEDYQVQVWDDSAGRYVSKSVFSGGAKDQFSLSLRLAFALATLPQELGSTPGFIFLDEPLSSFDGPRTEALVRLLTEGQVAANFSQIFVISHNRSFDVGAFHYHLVLRDGRLVESNLPPA
ncbi:MAG: AAA family ATPase [Actinobacteria bacterium]|nr:AAA family ATPase [Actinomycetota bacterium]